MKMHNSFVNLDNSFNYLVLNYTKLYRTRKYIFCLNIKYQQKMKYYI